MEPQPEPRQAEVAKPPLRGAPRAARGSFFQDAPHSFWPSILVFVAISVGTLILWRVLDSYVRESEHQEVQERATRLAGLGEILIAQRLVALENLVALWQELPPDRPEQWKAHAQYFLEAHSDILLIVSTELPPGSDGARLDDDTLSALRLTEEAADGGGPEIVRGSEVLEWFRELNRARAEDPEDPLFTARRRALENQSIQIVGPLPTPTGAPVIEIDIPASPEGNRVGLLTIVQRPSELFVPLTASWVRPYAVTIRAEDLSIFERGQAGEPIPPDFYWEEPLRLRTGETWRVKVAPTQEILDEPRWQFARVVLTTGLVIAVLIAGIIQLSQLARSRAQALGLANEELQARVDLIEHREAEIREINQSLEARVKERTETLNETIKELETYSYSVSHDLRSPLGAIVNFAAILQEDYHDRLDQQGHEYLRRVARCAQMAVAMMDSLLAFSRIGRQKMNLEPLEIEAAVRTIFSDLAVTSPTSSVELKIDALPCCKGDSAMIRLVISNLLSNALKFSKHSKPPRIEIGGHQTEEECVYFVRDNGVGFDMQKAKQLFGVFERLHSSEEYEGNGVGLAIVRRIVHRHGGRVWAEATPGQGATFYFSIPRSEV